MPNQIAFYPNNNPSPIVASGIVAGQSSSVAASTIYTVPAQGIYQICTGTLVTAAGSAGATLLSQIVYSNPVNTQTAAIGQTLAATTLGADSANTRANGTNQTFLLAPGPVQLMVTIGGSPATNPTFTYWYVITQL